MQMEIKTKTIIIGIILLCLFMPMFNSIINCNYANALTQNPPFQLSSGEGTATYIDPEDGRASVILFTSTAGASENSIFNYTEYTPPAQEFHLECYLNFSDTEDKSISIIFEDGTFIYLKFEPSIDQIYYKYPPSATADSVYPGIVLNVYHHLEVNITQTTTSEKNWNVYWNGELIIARTYTSDVNIRDIIARIHGSYQWKMADLIVDGTVAGTAHDNPIIPGYYGIIIFTISAISIISYRKQKIFLESAEK